nr:MAG TPA: hypothetical protein [Caudoviricetes sp.]DAX32488.1 MAG TPA: hypothetical protein [Caudoviricetes sp.]
MKLKLLPSLLFILLFRVIFTPLNLMYKKIYFKYKTCIYQYIIVHLR